MKRSEGRILTTHTGSLPRPPQLTRLFSQRSRGETVDAAVLERATREAVRGVIARQHEADIDIGNNGEQPREAFFLYLRRRLTGLGGSWRRPSRADVERYPGFKAMLQEELARKVFVSSVEEVPKAVGEVRYADRKAIQSECADFRDALSHAEAKFAEAFMSSPSPGIVATSIANEHYESEDAYLAALSAALRVEYEAIASAGFILQIDAPDLALERHMTFAERPLSDFLAFSERVADAINRAVENIPKERIRIHVCWGNSETPHDCDVPLREILPILSQVRAGALVLPFANPRHAHEIREFETLPLADDQILIAGVIDSLTNIIEHEEVVAERIERAARAVGDPARVIAGTDCGFDTSAGSGRVADDVVWAKLASMARGASIASKRLFAGAAHGGASKANSGFQERAATDWRSDRGADGDFGRQT